MVCSAAKDSYIPSNRTLIAALLKEKRIIVKDLVKKPEFDMKKINCWLSKEIPNSSFHRIACVELMGYKDFWIRDINELMFKSVFSTFRYMLEQASIWGIPVKRVALPILGTGRQRINNNYIIAPLLKQCMHALETIDQLEEIVFYELDREKLMYFVEHIKKVLNPSGKKDVFISYSSKQSNMAHRIYEIFKQHGFECWIAPECIPEGSDYIEEIPTALSQTKVLFLLLTPDAVLSKWVRKEVSTAIGSDHLIIPYRTENFELDQKFQFLMEGVQIYDSWKYELSVNREHIIRKITSKLVD